MTTTTPAARFRPCARWLAACGALVASAFILLCASQASAATYPDGGSTFSSGTEGWTGGDGECGPVSGGEILCSTETEYEASTGNPAGSIATSVKVTANVGGLFSGTASWTSPSFTVPGGAEVGDTSFFLDRALDAGNLVDLEAQGEVEVILNDETEGSQMSLYTETLDEADASFGTKGVDLPAGAIIAGHRYHLVIATTITSSAAEVGLLGEARMLYDNVRLVASGVEDSGGSGDGSDGSGGSGDGSGGGGGDNGSSPGVRVVRGPVSAREVNRLVKKLNVFAGAGHGPGGSLVPISRCTIIGTPRSDRIVGTPGNDVICGLGRNDRIVGRAGRDVIDGANGNDLLVGGAGHDLVLALRGNDRAYGSGGRDRIGGGVGNDRIGGGGGSDFLAGVAGNDRVAGSVGVDALGGGGGNDRLAGGPGPDYLFGRQGRDWMWGGPGADRFFARDHGVDFVRGGRGRDRAQLDRVDRRFARAVRR